VCRISYHQQEQDFANFGQTTGSEDYAAEAWKKLAAKFDDDGDGSITLEEFHNGLKYVQLPPLSLSRCLF